MRATEMPQTSHRRTKSLHCALWHCNDQWHTAPSPPFPCDFRCQSRALAHTARCSLSWDADSRAAVCGQNMSSEYRFLALPSVFQWAFRLQCQTALSSKCISFQLLRYSPVLQWLFDKFPDSQKRQSSSGPAVRSTAVFPAAIYFFLQAPLPLAEWLPHLLRQAVLAVFESKLIAAFPLFYTSHTVLLPFSALFPTPASAVSIRQYVFQRLLLRHSRAVAANHSVPLS